MSLPDLIWKICILATFFSETIPKISLLIDESIKNFQAIYSDNCRVYIRPSGTEPVIRVLVEAKSYKKVHSLSSEITNKLFLEINKIIN